MKDSRLLVWLEVGIACFAGALGIITAFWHDWIEALTGWDPDRHNGGIEWVIVMVLLAISVAAGSLASHHRRLLISRRDIAEPSS
jgi:hypothetical protein